MKIFITGTDTDIGKTLICSWLCRHSGYSYFKPIQTGSLISRDSSEVQRLANCQIWPESCIFPDPFSPHYAAELVHQEIDINQIQLPAASDLIIEGAGGVLVPINRKFLMIDLIAKFSTPVILVTRTGLGTINHTLLTLAALRSRNIPILGVIMNGEPNEANRVAIERYGNILVLATFPKLIDPNPGSIGSVPLSDELQKILRGSK